MSIYVRAGTERQLHARERSLHHLRNFYTTKIRDNLDEKARLEAKDALLDALGLHMQLIQKIMGDVRAYAPRYFEPRTQKMLPLTLAVLAARRETRLARAKQYQTESTKKKSRREKNT